MILSMNVSTDGHGHRDFHQGFIVFSGYCGDSEYSDDSSQFEVMWDSSGQKLVFDQLFEIDFE